jgi:hypothetical protein
MTEEIIVFGEVLHVHHLRWSPGDPSRREDDSTHGGTGPGLLSAREESSAGAWKAWDNSEDARPWSGERRETANTRSFGWNRAIQKSDGIRQIPLMDFVRGLLKNLFLHKQTEPRE